MEIVQKRQRLRFRYLQLLYELNGGDESEYVSDSSILSQLDAERDEIEKAIKYLEKVNISSRTRRADKSDSCIKVSREVEAKLANPTQVTSHFPQVVNILNVGQMNDSQIQQGTTASKQDNIRRGSASGVAGLDEIARMGSSVQEEADLRLYPDLWEKLFELRRAVGQLVESVSSTSVVRHDKDFIDLFNAYQTAVSKGEPFMSKSVFDPARKIVTLAREIHGNIGEKESLSDERQTRGADSEWLANERGRLDEENIAAFKEIDRLYQEVEIAIRRRVTS